MCATKLTKKVRKLAATKDEHAEISTKKVLKIHKIQPIWYCENATKIKILNKAYTKQNKGT